MLDTYNKIVLNISQLFYLQFYSIYNNELESKRD